MNAYPLDQISAPAMFVHAADDPLASCGAAVYAAARIPGLGLVTIQRGGHIFVGAETEIRKEITRSSRWSCKKEGAPA